MKKQSGENTWQAQ